ncbi:MAG TPA: acyltransferase [Candidatus Binatia bacterium]|jgi:peptidoglycan/LPS O-acetylase OafA/YrhL|nr:acyltransferase [Candidatus Binatia bacterium]
MREPVDSMADESIQEPKRDPAPLRPGSEPAIRDASGKPRGPKGGPVVRVDLLEGVRGMLASWVMLGHFSLFLGAATLIKTQGSSLLGKVAFLATNGDVPVCLFMCISGFVICHLIQSRAEPYGVYIARRFMRLFPALLCCFVLGLLVSYWQSSVPSRLPWGQDDWLTGQASKALLHRQYALANILAHLTMVHGLVPPSWWPDASGAFLGPAWSISTEWQFYLIAPLAVAAARKVSTLAVLCVGIVALQWAFSKLRLGAAMEHYNGAFLGFYIQYFFVGGVSYVLWRILRKAVSNAAVSQPRLQGLVLCGGTIAVFMLMPALTGLASGVSSLTPFLTTSIFAIWIFLFSCLCQITAAPQALEAKLIEKIGCSRAALFLGKASYSIYLVHFPVGMALLRLSEPAWGLPRPAFAVLFLVAGSLVTYACAGLLYHYLEAPAIDWAKKKFGER